MLTKNEGTGAKQIESEFDSAMLMECESFVQELDSTYLLLENPSSSTDHMLFNPKDLLGLYYSNFFPLKKILRWLSYGNERQYLLNREFSFTLANDAYVRYISFESPASFATKLQKDLPVKIDIGAVYNSRPTERKTIAGVNFRPVERELVFDIDMTDYNDVRTCCQDKNVCRKCWKFLAVAVKILDAALRDDFGFESILWVFSGRRGVHCWVSDLRARQMSLSSRKALVTYLEIVKGASEKKRILLPPELPPSVERALKIVRNAFVPIVLHDQEILSTNESRSKFLAMISDERLRQQVADLWSDSQVSAIAKPVDYWQMFVELVEDNKLGTGKTSPYHHRIPAEIQLCLLYPRLDSSVSIQLNHLLKSPFCVHPDTGKVCVPFRPAEVDIFDPTTVPTIQQAHTSFTSSGQSDSHLAPYLELFDEFIEGCEESRLKLLSQQREASDRTLAF